MDYLYVIVSGEVEIVNAPGKAEEQLLATHSPPASFGEIALFGDEGRSAGSRAGADLSLLGIEKDPFLALIYEHSAISIAIIYELTSIVRNQDEVRSALTAQSG
jgi:CRP-like cAMP-binding protein